MLSEEPGPAPPTMNSWVNRSAGVLIGAVTQRAQTRAGSDVAPRQLKRRGSASTLAWPLRAWLGILREKAPGKIVVVADGISDDHSDLLVLVEILRRLARSLAPRRPMGAERDTEDETNRGDRRVRQH